MDWNRQEKNWEERKEEVAKWKVRTLTFREKIEYLYNYTTDADDRQDAWVMINYLNTPLEKRTPELQAISEAAERRIVHLFTNN